MKDDSLSRTFNTLHMRYSQHINIRQDIRGLLWQGRLFSCVLDERHLYAAIRYVENNPIKANLVTKLKDYRWSSVYTPVSGERDNVLSDDCYMVEKIKDWSVYLREKEDTALIEDIRKSTKRGRPCGDDNFIIRLGSLLGRKLNTMPKGRPRKRQ